MKIHVPSMLAVGIEKINKQTQQTMAYKIHKSATKGLENITAATLALSCYAQFLYLTSSILSHALCLYCYTEQCSCLCTKSCLITSMLSGAQVLFLWCCINFSCHCTSPYFENSSQIYLSVYFHYLDISRTVLGNP